MKEILPLLHRDTMTVSGRSVSENVAGAVIRDKNVIRNFDEPWSTGRCRKELPLPPSPTHRLDRAVAPVRF